MGTLFAWDQLVSLVKVLAAAGFGGAILPLIVSFIVQVHWPSIYKEVVVLATCIITSFLGCLVIGLDMTNLIVVIPTMLISCRLTYQLYWKPTGLAEWIEQLTTPRLPQ